MVIQKKKVHQFEFIDNLQDALKKAITETRDHRDGGLASAGKSTGNRDASGLRIDDCLSR